MSKYVAVLAAALTFGVMLFGVALPDTVDATNRCVCDIRVILQPPDQDCSASGKQTYHTLPAQESVASFLSNVEPSTCDYTDFFEDTDNVLSFTAEFCSKMKGSETGKKSAKYDYSCKLVGPTPDGDPGEVFSPPRGVEKLNVLGLSGQSGVRELIGRIIRGFIGIIGTIALAMFIAGGIMFMVGDGAEKKKQAIQIIIWASLGIIIIMLSYLIVDFIFEGFRTKINQSFNQ